MTERPEDIQRRLHAVDEIGEVVGALRAIASGHIAAARGALEAISAYDAEVEQALARLAAPAPGPAAAGPGLLIVIGASQGFCGAYPARLVEAVRRDAPQGAGLLVVGQRSAAMLEDVGLSALWSADLPAAPAQVPMAASDLTDALLERSVTHPGPILTVAGRDLPGQPIETRRIWPPDPGDGAAPAAAANPALTTLPPDALIRRLLGEALFAAVARALMEGFRAENQARVEAMARAEGNLKTRRAELQRRFRQARQEQMTTEVIELSMGIGEG